mmetsp:Transcript_11788/g.29778  ORF Transcript_11788/g.29778 Transcript_11788/m.29778 type:complete len:247 (+) Transcript_11788:650-1390(+)
MSCCCTVRSGFCSAMSCCSAKACCCLRAVCSESRSAVRTGTERRVSFAAKESAERSLSASADGCPPPSSQVAGEKRGRCAIDGEEPCTGSGEEGVASVVLVLLLVVPCRSECALSMRLLELLRRGLLEPDDEEEDEDEELLRGLLRGLFERGLFFELPLFFDTDTRSMVSEGVDRLASPELRLRGVFFVLLLWLVDCFFFFLCLRRLDSGSSSMAWIGAGASSGTSSRSRYISSTLTCCGRILSYS